jgi:hypothetical protein
MLEQVLTAAADDLKQNRRTPKQLPHALLSTEY